MGLIMVPSQVQVQLSRAQDQEETTPFLLGA